MMTRERLDAFAHRTGHSLEDVVQRATIILEEERERWHHRIATLIAETRLDDGASFTDE
jgi:hypothetical protein